MGQRVGERTRWQRLQRCYFVAQDGAGFTVFALILLKEPTGARHVCQSRKRKQTKKSQAEFHRHGVIRQEGKLCRCYAGQIALAACGFLSTFEVSATIPELEAMGVHT